MYCDCKNILCVIMSKMQCIKYCYVDATENLSTFYTHIFTKDLRIGGKWGFEIRLNNSYTSVQKYECEVQSEICQSMGSIFSASTVLHQASRRLLISCNIMHCSVFKNFKLFGRWYQSLSQHCCRHD